MQETCQPVKKCHQHPALQLNEFRASPREAERCPPGSALGPGHGVRSHRYPLLVQRHRGPCSHPGARPPQPHWGGGDTARSAVSIPCANESEGSSEHVYFHTQCTDRPRAVNDGRAPRHRAGECVLGTADAPLASVPPRHPGVSWGSQHGAPEPLTKRGC